MSRINVVVILYLGNIRTEADLAVERHDITLVGNAETLELFVSKRVEQHRPVLCHLKLIIVILVQILALEFLYCIAVYLAEINLFAGTCSCAVYYLSRG